MKARRICATLLLAVATATAQRQIPSQVAAPGSMQDFSLGRFRPARRTVATLPSASVSTYQEYLVTDGSSSSDCTAGSGTSLVVCASTGSIWVAVGGAGGASGTVTVVGAGTLTSAKLVTGGGLQTIQTPSSNAGLDSSGNITATSLATGTSPPTVTAGTAGLFASGEGTAPTGVSAVDILYGDSTAHRFKVLNNNGSAATLVDVTGSITTGHCTQFIGTGGTVVDSGSACSAGGGITANWTTDSGSWQPPWAVGYDNTQAIGAPNRVICFEFTAPFTVVFKHFIFTAGTSTNHIAAAIGDENCDLVQQTATLTGLSSTAVFTLAADTTLTGGHVYHVVLTADDAGVTYDGIDNSDIPQQMIQIAVPRFFTCANPSTGTSTLLLPATCGARSSSTARPPIVTFYR